MADELFSVAEDLKNGRSPKSVTVREFLNWFGAQRRGYNIVHFIRTQLEEAGLETVPDFESAWLDGPIDFKSNSAPSLSENVELEQVMEPGIPVALMEPAISWISRDPSYRISKLAAANEGVFWVGPDAPLSEAVTLMMSRDFSQVPVMTGERSVRGVISWMSIGSRLALGRNGAFVRDLMQQAHEVRADSSIFDAISLIVRHGYVLVRNESQKVTGIVTASDLSLQFRTLTEPFLLLSEAENLIRNMIGKKFTPAQLALARDPGATDREIHNVADLTFGEYIRLLEKPERWEQLDLAIDRSLFCKDLDRVRKIRNDVTHFDPDGITSMDLEALRNFTTFLKQLEENGSL